ncbi:MAG: hypothetical protein LBI79_09175 [Nitrososphaerota archaeon]|jgi:hypothetical protein|nr:hypothetical protein [Nitrososphaerota archaeon]
MAKIQKSLALTVLMTLLVFAMFAAANLFVQGQASPTPTSMPTDHPTSSPTGTHSPTGTPTTSPSPTSPLVPTHTPPVTPSVSAPGVGGVDWNTWGWVVGGLIALLALLLIAWAVYRSRHSHYRHPAQDIHGRINTEEANTRRTYTTEKNTQRAYSDDLNRRNLRPEDSVERRVRTETDRLHTDDIDRRLYSEDSETS